MGEEEISNEEAALYFCDAKSGASELTKLDLDLYGSIRNWPKDFFGDEMEDIAATAATAAAARSRRTQPGD